MKFNKHNVTDNGVKARVWYSLDNNIHHAKCVTLYAKDYSGTLGKLFAEYVNNTDLTTDYFEKGKVVLLPDHPLYAAARAAAEAKVWQPIMSEREAKLARLTAHIAAKA